MYIIRPCYYDFNYKFWFNMDRLEDKDIDKLKGLAEGIKDMSATMCKITALMEKHFSTYSKEEMERIKRLPDF